MYVSSIGAPDSVDGIGIFFGIFDMNGYGGSMTFKLYSSLDVGNVVRDSYQLPVNVELMWTQATCIPPPPVRSSDVLLASSLKLKPWEQVRSIDGVVEEIQQE